MAYEIIRKINTWTSLLLYHEWGKLTNVIQVIHLYFLTSNRSCAPVLVSVYQIEVKMGTYTTNYNLFLPTIGEQGWGTLVNGNFTTIDTTMKGLDTRITAVENEVNGNLSCTSVTTSGTITSSGKITGNGGIAGTTGTFSGAVTATKFTPTSTTTINVTSGTPTTNGVGYDGANRVLIFVLPDVPKTQYTGGVKVTNQETYQIKIWHNTKWGNNLTETTIGASATYTISFANVPHVYIYAGVSAIKLGNITFS